MSGALPVVKLGPLSYQAVGYIQGGQLVCGAGGTISGGLYVAPTPTGSPSAAAQQVVALSATAITAAGYGTLTTAGSLFVIGVAGADANVLTMPALPSANAYGDQQLDISQLQDYVAVYTQGEFNVLYETTCPFGGALIPGIAGGVQYNAGAPDARAVIGRCTQPGGVGTASTQGLAFISTV